MQTQEGKCRDKLAFCAWMTRLELTHTAAAMALGCNRHTVRRYADGKSAIPRYIKLACSAIALGVREIQ